MIARVLQLALLLGPLLWAEIVHVVCLSLLLGPLLRPEIVHVVCLYIPRCEVAVFIASPPLPPDGSTRVLLARPEPPRPLPGRAYYS